MTGDGILARCSRRRPRPSGAPPDMVEAASSVDLGSGAPPACTRGEGELRGDDIGGLAVHIASRVSATAGAGEVLTTGTVRDLTVGSGIGFDGTAVVTPSRGCPASGSSWSCGGREPPARSGPPGRHGAAIRPDDDVEGRAGGLRGVRHGEVASPAPSSSQVKRVPVLSSESDAPSSGRPFIVGTA